MPVLSGRPPYGRGGRQVSRAPFAQLGCNLCWGDVCRLLGGRCLRRRCTPTSNYDRVRDGEARHRRRHFSLITGPGRMFRPSVQPNKNLHRRLESQRGQHTSCRVSLIINKRRGIRLGACSPLLATMPRETAKPFPKVARAVLLSRPGLLGTGCRTTTLDLLRRLRAAIAAARRQSLQGFW
jgi:hypothetical protein